MLPYLVQQLDYRYLSVSMLFFFYTMTQEYDGYLIDI
jgi:hypothetical protein